MKRKRQSLAALRRLAREAANTFDAYAEKLEAGLAVPIVTADTSVPFTRYDGDLMRQHTQAERIPHPRAPWQVKPDPEACRKAARLLRRNPDSIGRDAHAMTPITAEDTVHEARLLYGDKAAAVLCRQLETIDPDDYPAPAVKRWNRALEIIVREDANANPEPPTP